MHSFVDYKCDFSRKLLLFGAVCMVISSASATSVGDSVQVQMQTVGGALQSNQSARVPEWQTGAGGKMAFEVASIRPSAPGTFTPPNFPLSNDDSYKAVHGVFSADFPLWVYIQFAYKLGPSPDDLKIMLARVPKWVDTESFTIHARAGGDPTKDQMRLMVQSLLADRFKLAVHFETRVVPVLALTLERPGRTGPKLRPHAEGPACDVTVSLPAKGSPPSIPPVYPQVCDVQGRYRMPDHSILYGSRNTTVPLLAKALPLIGNLSRPIVDRTGLIGRFDYTLLFTPESDAAPGTDAAAPPDAEGTTFLQALKDQLGLKLTRTKAPLAFLVIDHVELPSEN
jgi:bla regulator protein blaR1